MATNLYEKYRPKNIEDVVGQPAATEILRKAIKREQIPHAIVLTGPPGTGKTTIAYILARRVCHISQKGDIQDFVEINAAEARGIDTVRDVFKAMSYRGFSGKSRCWLFDEAHMMSKDAQNAMLKLLEGTPEHVYFMLATTDPQKLIPTIHSRCTEVKLSPIKPLHIHQRLSWIARKEGIKTHDEVLDRIVEIADGGMRKAIVLLEQLTGTKEKSAQMALIEASDTKQAAINLCRMLMGFSGKPKWGEVSKLLKNVEGEPEDIRYLMLAYANSVLLGGGKFADKSAFIIEIFRDSFMYVGKAGLTAACWEVVNAK